MKADQIFNESSAPSSARRGKEYKMTPSINDIDASSKRGKDLDDVSKVVKEIDYDEQE